MTEILKEGGKTIIKTGSRIDTANAISLNKTSNPLSRMVA